MSLAKILREKYSSAAWGPPAPLTEWDIVLMDEGDARGQFIHAWNDTKLGPRPTDAEIATWLADYKPPAPSFTPARIIAAIKAIDPAKAEAILAATDEVSYAQFITAQTVAIDHPLLVHAMASVAITPEQLTAALAV